MLPCGFRAQSAQRLQRVPQPGCGSDTCRSRGQEPWRTHGVSVCSAAIMDSMDAGRGLNHRRLLLTVLEAGPPRSRTEQQRDRGHTASRGGCHLTPGLQPCACCPDSQTHLPQETGSEPCCWGHQTKARRLCSHARPVWGAVQRAPSGLPGGKGSPWCLWPRAAPAAPGAAPLFPTCDPSRPLAGGSPSGACCCRASLASVQPPGPPCAGPGTEQLPSRQDLPGCRSRLRGAAVSSAPGAGAAPGARAWPAFYFSYCLQVVTQLNHSANQGPITTHREERLKLGCSQDLVRHSRPPDAESVPLGRGRVGKIGERP
ncbi:uncharacterized protein LOC111168842 [Delphinapterus leucas]|uniref:Uncharacterized protein LOC111168842 n=1 Tax=Delphinapterus leucas TaxID=9749 RepID=A0A2Y9M7Z6_DELLE|nr:uncharacterized protein LOC111168842 [Delphinapterus leucas]